MLIITLIGLIGLAVIVAAFCIWAFRKMVKDAKERAAAARRVASINRTYHQELEEKYRCLLSPEEATLLASSRWN